jgi:hypothetical protein
VTPTNAVGVFLYVAPVPNSVLQFAHEVWLGSTSASHANGRNLSPLSLCGDITNRSPKNNR